MNRRISLVFLCVLYLVSNGKGLEFAVYRTSPRVPAYPASCGILRCNEITFPPTTFTPGVNPLDPRNGTFRRIHTMSIFKKVPPVPQSNEPERHELMVSMTSTSGNATSATSAPPPPQSTTPGGNSLDADGATLLYDLAKDGGCDSEFVCEVHGVNNQGRELVSSSTLRLQPEPGVEGDDDDDDWKMEFAVPLQILSLVQQMDSKMAFIERRLVVDAAEQGGDNSQDKIEYLQHKVDSVESRMEIFKQNRQVLNKIDQLDFKMSDFMRGRNNFEKEPAESKNGSVEVSMISLLMDQKIALEDLAQQCDEGQQSFANISAMLLSVESKLSQATACSRVNLTEVPGWDGFAQRLLDGSLTSQQELLRVVATELKSAVYNSTVEALSTLQPSRCNRGMSPALAQYPYPYHVISPGPESDLDVPYLCDTISDGGGWIVIQRRSTGHVNFSRTWADYKNGFGTPDDDFWLGNDNIHSLTSKGSWELKVDLKSDNETGFAIYTPFSVAGEEDKYKITVGDHEGTLPEKLTYQNGMQFTTVDADNDNMAPHNCASRWGGGGGWWYNSCDEANPNGKWNNATDHGMEWKGFTDDTNVIIVFSEMKIRRT